MEDLVKKVCTQADLAHQVNNKIVSVKSTRIIVADTVVAGRVTDLAVKGVADVAVENSDLNISSITTADGCFSIRARSNDDLVFTHISYNRTSLKIKSPLSNTLAVIIGSTSQDLSEVVVTSLGIKRENRALSYAVGEVKGEDMLLTDAVAFNSFRKVTIQQSAYEKQINSFYGMLSSSFKNYLFLDATVRRDASSTLIQANNTYWYPSVGTSFIVSNAFGLKSKTLTYAKIRASAAEVGSDTDPYQLAINYGLEQFQPGEGAIGGVISTTKPEPLLKPTRTRSFEAGMDLNFFNSRVIFEMTYYTQKSREQINLIDVPTSSGYTRQILNAGTISNKGVEFLFSTKLVVKKNFSWDLILNAARNKNTVESLAEDVTYLTLSDARWLGLSIIAQPGLAYGSIIGYDYQRTETGEVILDPVTLSPLATDERQVLGKGTWDWTGGISNTFRYKNLSLSAVIDIKTGADLFSMTNLFAVIRGQERSTLPGRKSWGANINIRF